ncbi:hypothetical protein K439DRAFT_1636533 [Ramaria rubella]|nr:hypothetical protein K439DRAFT_1636533 [Ramaria rubella]
MYMSLVVLVILRCMLGLQNSNALGFLRKKGIPENLQSSNVNRRLVGTSGTSSGSVINPDRWASNAFLQDVSGAVL